MHLGNITSPDIFPSRGRISYFMILISGDLKDADVDSCGVYVQELLYHNGNVPSDALLCLRWGHSLWLCETWREPGKVRSILFLLIKISSAS